MTELCNVACSSVMPGGGTNLELALHCLHEAQGNVQVKWRQGQGEWASGETPRAGSGRCMPWAVCLGVCGS